MIDVREITFSYPKEEGQSADAVLSQISLTIQPGEFVAILGRNGSGKSTLAKHFNAILLPSGGSVWVENFPTSDPALLFEIRRRVGMVFQNPDNQIVATVVEEDVAFAPENLGVPSEEIRKRVDEALEAVGMKEYQMHAPHLLSGGQKQRIAIAGVLAMQSAYLVLDEPTAMLDPIGRREVMTTIQRLNQQQHMTVVLITHNMEEAILADRIVVMQEGAIVREGTPREIFSDVEGIQELGLDVPQVTEIAARLHKQGFPVRTDVLTCEEFVEQITALMEASYDKLY